MKHKSTAIFRRRRPEGRLCVRVTKPVDTVETGEHPLAHSVSGNTQGQQGSFFSHKLLINAPPEGTSDSAAHNRARRAAGLCHRPYHPGGHTGRHAAGRNVAGHHGVRADNRAVADCHAGHNAYVPAEPDILSDCHRACGT